MKKLIAELRKRGFEEEAKQVEKVIAKGWETLPRGWTKESAKKFWNSLTGDRKHKITKCMKKMKDVVDDPGAFCAGLARLVEYTPKK